MLSSAEFVENLKAYLGKQLGRSYITLDEYRVAVQSFR